MRRSKQFVSIWKGRGERREELLLRYARAGASVTVTADESVALEGPGAVMVILIDLLCLAGYESRERIL